MREFEKHIRDNHADNKGKSWCGERIDNCFIWCFLDIDHAAMNARNGGRLVPCPKCLKAVLAALGGQA